MSSSSGERHVCAHVCARMHACAHVCAHRRLLAGSLSGVAWWSGVVIFVVGALAHVRTRTCVRTCAHACARVHACAHVCEHRRLLAGLSACSGGCCCEERSEIRAALKRKAKRVTERLNAIEGISCQPIEGAMYAFPKVNIEGATLKKAIAASKPADLIYCMEMVERTGIVTVPGSGFGQRPGTFHFRMTILPDEATLETVLDDIERFHGEHAKGWSN